MMARETKIGMLVGLGFIICFAIILENRGRQAQTGHDGSQSALVQNEPAGAVSTPSLVERRAQHYGAQSAAPSSLAGDDRARTHRPASSADRSADPGASAPTRSVPQAPSGGDASRERPGTSNDDSSNPPRPIRGRQRGSTPGERLAAGNADPNGAPGSTATEGTADVLSSTLTASPPSTPPSGAASPPSDGVVASRSREHSESSVPPPSQSARTYKVKKGDTLSRIAAEQYGSRSPKVIDAIYQANKGTLSNPAAIRLDQEIVLPTIEGVGPPKGGVAEQPAAEPERSGQTPRPVDTPKTTPDDSDYRYYQIRKGDRLASIAKEQLGSASRWKEIAELNRDILPDPSRIRDGVRIRLPRNGKSRASGEPHS